MNGADSTVDLTLVSITQPETRYIRDIEVDPSKRAQVGQNVSTADEAPTIFNSQMTVSVFGDDEAETDDQIAFQFYSDVRVEFAIRPEQGDRVSPATEIGGVIDYVRRLADPYHRQTLADAMTRAGLPPITLPLPQAEGWETSDERASRSGV